MHDGCPADPNGCLELCREDFHEQSTAHTPGLPGQARMALYSSRWGFSPLIIWNKRTMSSDCRGQIPLIQQVPEQSTVRLKPSTLFKMGECMLSCTHLPLFCGMCPGFTVAVASSPQPASCTWEQPLSRRPANVLADGHHSWQKVKSPSAICQCPAIQRTSCKD